MKNFNFLLGIGVLALASCSNDEMVVNPAVDGASGEAAIGFAVSTGNMSRADGPNATQLSEKYWEFGVWAYKAENAASDGSDGNTVMKDYMVGYWDVTNKRGYEPTLGQKLYGSSDEHYWYYEGLGYTQQDTDRPDLEGGNLGTGFFFRAGSTGRNAEQSANPTQYLKYWDKSKEFTWFYAYAPYSAEVSFDPENHVMTFPEITPETAADYMYAATKQNNPPATDIAVKPEQYVDLTFYRLLSKIRVAFYEVIDGYSVELIPYNNTSYFGADDLWRDFGANAMYAVPSKKKSETEYEAGSYINKATPKVTFAASDYDKGTISYDTYSPTYDKIIIPLWFHAMNDLTGPETLVLGGDRDHAIVNDAKCVLPASTAKPNDGFTLNLSLKLTATDTGEIILIKGIKVHVPAADCQWKPNHLYTYYFKITKTVPGKPTDPDDPDPEPDPKPYLLPIVFDQVTVEAFEDHKVNNGDYNVGNE